MNVILLYDNVRDIVRSSCYNYDRQLLHFNFNVFFVEKIKLLHVVRLAGK